MEGYIEFGRGMSCENSSVVKGHIWNISSVPAEFRALVESQILERSEAEEMFGMWNESECMGFEELITFSHCILTTSAAFRRYSFVDNCIFRPLVSIFCGFLGELTVLLTLLRKEFRANFSFIYLRCLAGMALFRIFFTSLYSICYCTEGGSAFCVYLRGVGLSFANLFTAATTVVLGMIVDRVIALFIPLKYRLVKRRRFFVFFVLLGFLKGICYPLRALGTVLVAKNNQSVAVRADWYAKIHKPADRFLVIFNQAESVLIVLGTGAILFGLFRARQRKLTLRNGRADEGSRNMQIVFMLLCQAVPLLCFRLVGLILSYVQEGRISEVEAMKLPFEAAMTFSCRPIERVAILFPFNQVLAVFTYHFDFFLYYAFNARFRANFHAMLGEMWNSRCRVACRPNRVHPM